MSTSAIIIIINLVINYFILYQATLDLFAPIVLMVLVLLWSYYISEWFNVLFANARRISHLPPQIENRVMNALNEEMNMGKLYGYLPNHIRVYYIDDYSMNAYTFGPHSIALTKGLCQLDSSQIKAVIAHELGHIHNLDILCQQLLFIQFIVIAFCISFVGWIFAAVIFLCFMCSEKSFFSMFMYRGAKKVNNGVFGFCQQIVFGIYKFIALIISRYSEYQADDYAVKIDQANAFALKAFFYRFQNNNQQGFLSNFYASHPTIASRISRIDQNNP